MAIKEASLRKIKNGFVVSYWKSPDAPKGRKQHECGMGEHIEEHFDGGKEAGERLEEIMS